MNVVCNALALALGLALATPAPAQDHAAHAAAEAKQAHPKSHRPNAATGHDATEIVPMERADMDHASMEHGQADASPAAQPGIDHSGMDHPPMDHGAMKHGATAPASTDHADMDHASMDHGEMDHAQADAPSAARPGIDHSRMDHSPADHGAMEHGAADSAPMDHAAMGHGAPAAGPREPIPVPSDADRAAAFPVLSHPRGAHGGAAHWQVLLDRLETWDADRGRGQAWEGSAWIGGDIDRLWLRSEGEREDGHTRASELEVLYGRSVAAWWDLLAGVKQDFRPGDSRTWAAFGVQGLAPYKFEVSATAYLGESGQVAATLETEYELLLTHRLILQPRVEMRLSARDEPEYGDGRGLNRMEAGLRLRYEISRRFAPYVGIVHERRFGDTADHARDHGEEARDTRFVAGVRIWF